MTAPRTLNIFFDVDYTLLAVDGSLRPRTREIFEKLVADGHRLFIWSGIGNRTSDIRRHGLHDLVASVFVKPLEDFEAGLRAFGVTVRPDFVVDDYPSIVNAFGGAVVRPYYFPSPEDDEMQRVYQIVVDYVTKGYSQDAAFRPGLNGQGRQGR